MSEKNLNANNNNKFRSTVKTLVDGADAFISAKTVLGDPITVGDTVVLPLCDVSFGVGAGSFGKSESANAGGGVHGKMTPSAVLVIKDGVSRIVNIRDQDTFTKIMNAAPDVIDRLSSFVKGKSKKKGAEDDIDEAVDEAFSDI